MLSIFYINFSPWVVDWSSIVVAKMAAIGLKQVLCKVRFSRWNSLKCVLHWDHNGSST
jgi:hypothetical protein